MWIAFFTWTVDLDALTDEAFAFVTDPRASRNERDVIHALNDMRPDVVDVLESMVYGRNRGTAGCRRFPPGHLLAEDAHSAQLRLTTTSDQIRSLIRHGRDV